MNDEMKEEKKKPFFPFSSLMLKCYILTFSIFVTQ